MHFSLLKQKHFVEIEPRKPPKMSMLVSRNRVSLELENSAEVISHSIPFYRVKSHPEKSYRNKLYYVESV